MGGPGSSGRHEEALPLLSRSIPICPGHCDQSCALQLMFQGLSPAVSLGHPICKVRQLLLCQAQEKGAGPLRSPAPGAGQLARRRPQSSSLSTRGDPGAPGKCHGVAVVPCPILDSLFYCSCGHISSQRWDIPEASWPPGDSLAVGGGRQVRGRDHGSGSHQVLGWPCAMEKSVRHGGGQGTAGRGHCQACARVWRGWLWAKVTGPGCHRPG